MDVILRPTTREAVSLFTRLIEAELEKKPGLVLGLATGRTMEPVYELLVQRHRAGALDLSCCRFFALDEYLGLPTSDQRSYHHYLDSHLLGPVNAGPERKHLPDGANVDREAATRGYEEMIRHLGGIDLQLLGLGENGHIGFNEPGSSLASRTRDVTLARETLEQNACMFGGDPASVPSRAITMGLGTILESESCLLLATGRSKAKALAAAVEGPLTSMVPASSLQLHPSSVVVADEEAGAGLTRRDHYRRAFEHNPDWATLRDDDDKVKNS